MRGTSRFRYMDSDGTWEVSTGGFTLVRDPDETMEVIRQWPSDTVQRVLKVLSNGETGIVILKGSEY